MQFSIALLVRQGECVQGIGSLFRLILGTEQSAASGGNHHELFMTLLSPKRHGRGMPIGFEPSHPEFLPCLGIESPEATVISTGNEIQPARRGNRSSQARHARPGNALRFQRSEEHTSELQSPYDLVCRLLL